MDISCLITLEEFKNMILKESVFSHVTSYKFLRIWHKDRLLKRDTFTLKKQYVSSDSTLTVQILPYEEQEFGANAVLLYVHLRDSSTFTFNNAIELYYGGNTYEDLLEAISKKLDLPKEKLRLAKYQPYNGKWLILEEPKPVKSIESKESKPSEKIKNNNKENNNTKTNKKQGNKNNNTSENKGKKFFFLRDGDIIVAKNFITRS